MRERRDGAVLMFLGLESALTVEGFNVRVGGNFHVSRILETSKYD